MRGGTEGFLAKHHYVPEFVVRNFLSADGQTALYDPRHWSPGDPKPGGQHLLSVLRKSARNTPYVKMQGRFVRRGYKDLLWGEGVNALTPATDPLQRGLLRMYLRQMERAKDPDDPDQTEEEDPETAWIRSIADIRGFGQMPQSAIDTEVVESKYLNDRIDRPLSLMVRHLLRPKQVISEECRLLLGKAVMLSNIRSPVYMRHHFENMRRSSIHHAHSSMPSDLMKEATAELAAQGLVWEDIFGVFDRHIYHWQLIQMAKQRRPLIQRELQVAVLHAPKGINFVTCDNASRSFLHYDLEESFRKPAPGLGKPEAAMVMPLGPDLCVMVSLDPDYPDREHVDVDEDVVRAINTALLIAADDTVISVNNSVEVFEPWVIRHGRVRRIPRLAQP